MDLKLQILVCTFGQRLRSIDVSGWPMLPGVQYVISCQNPDHLDLSATAAALEARPDIKVHFFFDRGLSLNRNHAIDLASAPLIFIADDDLSFRTDGLLRIIDIFAQDPALDVLTCRSEMPEERTYPPDGHNLRKPWPYYWTISFEIAIRRDAIARAGLRFTPLAGIGAPYLSAGEEELFMLRAIRAGLTCRFTDTVVAIHPGSTTGVREALRPGVIRAKGCLMYMQRGLAAALPRLPLEAYRNPAPLLKALRHLTQGMIYAIKHRDEL